MSRCQYNEKVTVMGGEQRCSVGLMQSYAQADSFSSRRASIL